MGLKNLLLKTRLSFLFVAVLVMTSLILVTTVVQGQPEATPSPTTGSENSTGLAVLGQVISLAPDETFFTLQPDNQPQKDIQVSPETRYTIINISPFTLSLILDAIGGLMGPLNTSGTPAMAGMNNTQGIDVLLNGLDQNNQAGSFSDLHIGDMVIARGTTSDNVADNIQILRFPDNIQFVLGTVSGISDQGLVVTPFNPAFGSAVSFGLGFQ